MAPAPKNAVSRVKVQYTGPLGTHTMLFHGRTGVTTSALQSGVASLITAFLPMQWNGTVWGNAESAEPGSAIFTPIGTVGGTASTAFNPDATSDPGLFVQFGGRGPDGRRVKLYLYETAFKSSRRMRVKAGDSTDVDAVHAVLAASGSVIGTITGSTPLWKTYANIQNNKKLVNDARKSS